MWTELADSAAFDAAATTTPGGFVAREDVD